MVAVAVAAVTKQRLRGAVAVAAMVAVAEAAVTKQRLRGVAEAAMVAVEVAVAMQRSGGVAADDDHETDTGCSTGESAVTRHRRHRRSR